VTASSDLDVRGGTYRFEWQVPGSGPILDVRPVGSLLRSVIDWDTTGLAPRNDVIRVRLQYRKPGEVDFHPIVIRGAAEAASHTVFVVPRPISRQDTIPVTLRRTSHPLTDNAALWVVIRRSTVNLGFTRYQHFMDYLLCGIPLPGLDAGQRPAA